MTFALFSKFLMVTTIMSLFACGETTNTNAEQLNIQVPNQTITSQKTIPLDTSIHNKYVWKQEIQVEAKLINRFPAPSGYQRTGLPKGSFGDWLRHIPLKPEGSKVLLYYGEEKHRQDVHAAVIDIDTGNKDLQQCADAVMRVKAEYHYANKEYDKIHFNYTSGDRVAFNDWRQGKKPSVKGSKVYFCAKTGKTDNSYRNFRRYMTSIFSYAGTASLSKEMKSVNIADMQVGDVFIQGGFPGHAVIVVDMAESPQTGKKLFMIAQSYMPAQDFHVLKNPESEILSPWYDLDFGSSLNTPEWGFSSSDLKRFVE